MIQVKDIVKSFDGNVVLNHVSADFEDGKVNMIIGQSGSGKTVLMKSMIGLHMIDSGQIVFDTSGGKQQDLAGMTEKEVRMLHREVGMLFQGAALFDSMTVQENVMYPLEMFSDMSKTEMVERARFCLERVNMPERAFGLMPSEISGGMQKRVAIARAIALNPKYLFCDEPNSGLDPRTSLVIDKLIQDITQEYGICTIVNSHDMNSIMEIGDNIVFLRNGIKEWQGSRHDIFHAENEALNEFVFASELFKKVKTANK
ncbi:MAG: ATP-binding cassette domain-containing protein [Paludibacteraceae bacterium]|jgi:phospholipid/cholesterol/gamma-HCH transport system ATP-binding protein|nr:ATP-binding cassette domain-containing protein [Paludibacteraceae bacterium]MBQ5774560.1 ATP-binding cassette domain-containing protein [Paludibacteraceae bacterium]